MLRWTGTCVVFGVLLLAAPDAHAARRLPPVANEALTSAEKLLGHKAGDERSFACIDALPFLRIVYANVPDYGYSTGLYAECLFRTEDWPHAEKMLEKYLTLVPLAARHGEVAEKVERAEERLRTCRLKLGHALGDLPPPPGMVVATKPTVAPDPPLVVVVTPDEPRVAPIPKPVATPAPIVKTPPPPASSKPELLSAVSPATPPAGDFGLPPESNPPAKPTAPKRTRQVIVRAGYSPLAGGFGLSVEGRLGLVGVVLGSGGYPLSLGVTFSNPSGKGGPYASVHALLDMSSLFVAREKSGVGFGATAGWDYRPTPRVSLQGGLGGGYDTVLGPIVTADLCAGIVFEL